jgi:hypothetical protein
MSQLHATADRIGARVGLDPIIVITAITAITQLITLCLAPDPSPEQVAKAAKYPRRRHRRAMRNAVRRELDARGQADKLDGMMTAVHDEIGAMSIEAIADVCRECSQITADYN